MKSAEDWFDMLINGEVDKNIITAIQQDARQDLLERIKELEHAVREQNQTITDQYSTIVKYRKGI